jgi:hypothetical protein
LLTDDRTIRLSSLGEQLEEQYLRYTEELTLHTGRLRGGADAGTLAMIAGCRQVLADTARALRHLAEGRYGPARRAGATFPSPAGRFASQVLRCQRWHNCP